MNVRVRGIYATALTSRLLAADHEVVDPSEPIRRRFDAEFGSGPHEVAIESAEDRGGVGIIGDSDGVETVANLLGEVAIDALGHDDPTPRGAVFDAAVTDTVRGGAVVDLDGQEGYLPFSDTDDRIEEGDELRVQVYEPAAPWGDDRPLVGTELRAYAGPATLRKGKEGTTVDGRGGPAARELAGLTELVDVDVPEGWGIAWDRAAVNAEMADLRSSLTRAAERAELLADLDEEVEPPRRLAAPEATAWCWFGREARFALDADRREVTTTMPGHHRVKVSGDRAGDAVDFAEALAADRAGSFGEGWDAGEGDDGEGDDGEPADAEFPFEAVTSKFGPGADDEVRIEHGKPDGRLFSLGRGRVSTLDVADREITVRRTMSSRGTYDALGTEREPGDVAITRLREGRWWYPTVYRGEDGDSKGTYVNICTPLEIFPDAVRYVDLHVDVIKHPDGTVERVDDDELDAAVEAGDVSDELAEKAREVARTIEDAFGG